MKFSDRIGVTSPSLNLQIDSMSQELRYSLWNLFFSLYDDGKRGGYWHSATDLVARFFRKVPLDELPNFYSRRATWFKDYFQNLQWFEAFNLVEFLVTNHCRLTTMRGTGHPTPVNQVRNSINYILEMEHSGYRFIDEILSPITDQVEIDAVGEAVITLKEKRLNEAGIHIKTALELFSKRPEPDYRNSIKEAICAIESIAKQLGTDQGDGLAPALRVLKEKASLHGSLSAAFEKLYGYASDENGIRHAMLKDSTVGFDEAKFMIVACSAFTNYLASKAEVSGLL